MTGELQAIPARHGVATFVPKGHSIKIINTYGTQVVDTWAFVLHKPPHDEAEAEKEAQAEFEKAEEVLQEQLNKQQAQERTVDTQVGEKNTNDTEGGANKAPEVVHDKESTAPQTEPEKSKKEHVDTEPSHEVIEQAKKAPSEVGKEPRKGWSSYVPSLRGRTKVRPTDATDASKEQAKKDEPTSKEASTTKEPEAKASEEDTKGEKSEEDDTDNKSVKSTRSTRTWGSYIPSIRNRSKGSPTQDAGSGATTPKEGESAKKGWLSYLPSGSSFTSYLPSQGAISAFAASHHRDPTKSYAEQLYEFSKTPVGAASLSAATGSGTAGSLYAAFVAYNKLQASQHSSEPMEYLSLPHTLAAAQHLSPVPGDALLSNLHESLLMLVEDTSPAGNGGPRHGTLLPACDPQVYKDLGMEQSEHGSCAENLVMALRELNQSAGLQGVRAVGADVTVNSAPTPLSLFMNVQIGLGSEEGNDVGVVVKEPKTYEGGKWGKLGEKGGYVKLKAEKDVVIVMSACPMDVGPVNGGRCRAANFVVEEPEEEIKKREEETKAKEKAKEEENEKKKRRDSGQADARGEASAEKSTASTIKNTSDVSDSTEKRADAEHSSGVQTPKTDTSAEPIRNSPKPGRKKPKKLERRSKSESL